MSAMTSTVDYIDDVIMQYFQPGSGLILLCSPKLHVIMTELCSYPHVFIQTKTKQNELLRLNQGCLKCGLGAVCGPRSDFVRLSTAKQKWHKFGFPAQGWRLMH
ncbi:hypothetical protein ATANTOWER_017638 [Ataeniobius toweri]|uniref:Uncharacterized protein n=1 Tax=Ataeniobius toweri TaxID=208326 RepID=A0ABU7AU40_9TELE|nr:hypothetical protein [Ataeniobius toweri]